MKDKTVIGLCALVSMIAHWMFELGGADEFRVTRWFLAFCIFSAAYFVVGSLERRDG